jgi:hypothetical protein
MDLASSNLPFSVCAEASIPERRSDLAFEFAIFLRKCGNSLCRKEISKNIPAARVMAELPHS